MKFLTLSSLILLFATALLNGCASLSSSYSDPDDYTIQRTLEDRMLVLDIHNLFKKLTLVMQSLPEKTHARHLDLQTRNLKRQLYVRRSNLLECSNEHLGQKLDLALDCAYLAHKVSQSSESEENLKRIKKLIVDKARESLVADKGKSKGAASKSRQGKQSSQPNYRTSIDALNRFLEVAPEEGEAKQLLIQLKSIQGKRIASLMARGDRLYREEKVAEALTVWREAVKFDDNNKAISDRIARARKVLGEVNKIKRLPKPKRDS